MGVNHHFQKHFSNIGMVISIGERMLSSWWEKKQPAAGHWQSLSHA